MQRSIVKYLGKDESSCGYCKSTSDNVNHGMWAHTLTVEDYQNLIDRGWRRCGLYCYKPVMNEICCPAYTIRCDVLTFKLSKSQKKVLRHFNAFLKKPENSDEEATTSKARAVDSKDMEFKIPKPIDLKPLSVKEMELTASYPVPQEKMGTVSNRIPETKNCGGNNVLQMKHKPGVGEDESKPRCKKAKLIRMERRAEKLQKKGISVLIPQTKSNVSEKTLEDYINECEGSLARKLDLTLVPACSNETILQECWQLFKKYQTIIHNDDEDECTFSSFSSFLVSSPLQALKDDRGPPSGYGSFHQLYRLDGKLIAVGVIDILPRCISSVYFFYDPAYSYLSLGTYGSLRELELTRHYAKICPLLNQYYLGFYIHSCPKMKYKGKIKPAWLLCPEVYTWHPIESCLGKIDASKYSRLNDDPGAKSEEDNVNINEIVLLSEQGIMRYPMFKALENLTTEDQDLIQEYAFLVGNSTAKRMILRW